MGYYWLKNNEVAINDIHAESFLVDIEGQETQLFLIDHTIYNDKNYVILSKDKNYLENSTDDELYIFRAKVHDGNCTLIELDDESADAIIDYWNETDENALMAHELNQWDKLCTRVVDGFLDLTIKSLKEAKVVSIVCIVLFGIGFLFLML